MSRCGCSSHGGFLTAKGLVEAAQRDAFAHLDPLGVDASSYQLYLDKVGSVSASMGPLIHWDDGLIDQQYRRFLSGS